MKTLALTVRKGGVGKTTLALQYAYYLHQKRGLRVLVIDLDDQGNLSDGLKKGRLAVLSDTPASALMTGTLPALESDGLLYLSADDDVLRNVECKPEHHNDYAGNVRTNLAALSEQFDVCIIDTNPSADIRVLSVMVSADYVVTPLTLSAESISGLQLFMTHPSIGFNRIKQALNPKLEFIGAIPNMVDKTSAFQKASLTSLIEQLGKVLLQAGSGFAVIPKSTAVLEAQADGVPLWTIKKTSAKDLWTKHLHPAFEAVAAAMALPDET